MASVEKDGAYAVAGGGAGASRVVDGGGDGRNNDTYAEVKRARPNTSTG
jgi:hypothetical protein